MTIRKLDSLAVPGFDALAASARSERFQFIDRLLAEWESGENRFSRPGEGFWGAFEGDKIVGTAGLNRLPDVPEEGRGRRVYVMPEFRQKGIGRALMQEVIEAAAPTANKLVLRTNNPVAAEFYARLGFVEVENMPSVTHVLVFK